MAERLTPQQIAARIAAWLAHAPALPAPDEATRAFCLQRLALFSDGALLERKFAAEIGSRPFAPLGRVLMVIAEGDVLGTAAGFIAALATGNRMRIKARDTLPLLASLKAAFALDDTDCELLDWASATQDDDAVLADVDAVLVAGGAETIAHYRRVTPPNVRLIEYGPRVSAAALWPGEYAPARLDALADALVREVALFAQNVCSSPQFVLVPDLATARRLSGALRARLSAMPPLPADVRLAQLACARELELRARLGEPFEVGFDTATGWGFTVSEAFDPGAWLPRGFRLIAGDACAHLATAARAFPRALQTLGEAGCRPAELPLHVYRRCEIGRMHERPLLAPHDGMLELPQFVNFLCTE